VGFGSLLFVADKFGDLSLQEPESQKIIGPGTDHLPPTLVRAGLVNEAQLGHGSIEPGEADSGPSGDNANHNKIAHSSVADPIY
jgi:hypothetical protein